MPRFARIVIPGIPHHVTQRGNRRQITFFNDSDYRTYIGFMSMSCKAYGVEIWAYCLMPNHIHLIAVPSTETSLSQAIGDAHQRYSRFINSRFGWNGYLWQGRFFSCPLDDRHLFNTARYVELNPVRAGICKLPEDYVWSSARAHLRLTKDTDVLVNIEQLISAYPDWRACLSQGLQDDELEKIRKHCRTGRPLGSENFIRNLEAIAERPLKAQKRGRKKIIMSE